MLKQNILLVDDHPENLIALEAVLEAPDRNLVKAYSGQDALGLALKMDFALVLLDVQMPEMDGFEVASWMRKNKRTRSIPIIFVTAINKDQQYIFKGYESGAIDYLFKPVDPIILTHKVSFFLELDEKNRLLQNRIDEIIRLKETNELLLKSVGEALIGVDVSGNITFANPAASEVFNVPADNLLQQNISSLLAYDDTDENPFVWQESATFLKCSQGITDKKDFNIYGLRDKRTFPVEFIATPISKSGESLSGAVFALRDITQRREIEEKLIYSARYDPLTGLVNRNYFEQMLENSLARARRNDDMVGLIFLDLDHFKEVNDTLGHNVGDVLLKEVALRLKSCIREVDTLCRLGGDEFTLILEAIHEEENIVTVATKLLKKLAERFFINVSNTVYEVHVGASIGLASFPDSADTVPSLLKCADIAMYQAKSLGRNNYQVYNSHMEAKVRRTLELENNLRAGIQNKEFVLHYQPQVDLRTGHIVGVEALVRWAPPNGPMISPAEFIPIAEESGLIVELGFWILKKACEDIAVIQSNSAIPVTVSVNLSIRQLISNDITSVVKSIVDDSNIDPSLLNLEITESMVMDNPEEKIARLNELRKLGLSISVDDFGTGYSSLTYIKRLPISALKIDRAFIEYIGNDAQGETIVRTIISMADNLNLKVVAEGVETREQLQFLALNNCPVIQGFYFSKPLPLTQFLELQKTGFPPANDDRMSFRVDSAANG